jgi:hypothetical protein|tara:strand:+ start:551 stop:757 length:207 start_codon:yes stop_codon:yes gene_type:complete
MKNKELQKTLDRIKFNQSDLARLIYDTDTINQSQRNIINRYLTGHTKAPIWLFVLLRLYAALNKIKLH